MMLLVVCVGCDLVVCVVSDVLLICRVNGNSTSRSFCGGCCCYEILFLLVVVGEDEELCFAVCLLMCLGVRGWTVD